MTKLFPGDTVIAKHPVCTDGKWEKGVVYQINDFYEIRLSNGSKTLVINKTNIIYDVNIIKVSSDFNMKCNNCKYYSNPFKKEPCSKCSESYSHWEPCDLLRLKNKRLDGLDINSFSIDEGPFTDKKFDYSYISTSRCNTANALERRIRDKLLAGKLKIEKLDMTSMYPDLKGGYSLTANDNVDALRYFTEFMADFNKKENKNMKKQQKKRNRNILVVKELNTAIEFDEIKFNGPATIIKWKPTFKQLAFDEKPDKTVTVAKEPDKFDKTTGFLLAVLKEILDNKSYGNILEKIDEIKEFDEFSKQTVEADLSNKTKLHCSIKDLKEQTEALENVYVPGSVVRYRNGKKYYKVLCYRFDENLKEMVYILQTYKGTCFTDNDLEGTYKRNVPHSKLIRVRRK